MILVNHTSQTSQKNKMVLMSQNASYSSNQRKSKIERKRNKNQKIKRSTIDFYSYNILETGYIFSHNFRFNVPIEHVYEHSILTNQHEIDVVNSKKSFYIIKDNLTIVFPLILRPIRVYNETINQVQYFSKVFTI